MTYVEKCLYEYKSNIAVLEYLQEEKNNLMSIHGHSYDIENKSSMSNPVLTTVNQSMELEKKIACLKRKIVPVRKLLDDLAVGKSLRVQQMREILISKYVAHEDNQHVQEKMCVSVSTYWRRVREFLRLARKYFGKIE